MTIQRFQVFDNVHGTSVAIIEMDTELLRPEARIIDPETLTLRYLKNGDSYTLYPIEDHLAAILNELRGSYERLTKQPTESLSGYISGTDDVIDAVRALFQEITYTVIESAKDLENLISPPKDGYEPKTKKYDIVADLLAATKVCSE